MPRAHNSRFFVEKFSVGQFALPAGEARHAASALRLSAGDTVTIFDGKGATATAEIISAAKREVIVKVDEIQLHKPAEIQIELAFAIPKAKRLDWLLEKTTELGVNKLTPIIFERSVAGGEKLTASKRERWLGHCVSACKQCGSNFLPEIAPMQSLADFLIAPISGLGIIGDLDKSTKPISKIITADTPKKITLLVGPEGGFSPAEREQIIAANFFPAKLGDTILRTETACVALISAVRAVCESL